MFKRTVFCLLIVVIAAACQPDVTLPTPTPPRVAAKLLATVYMTPTPDAAALEATRRVIIPTSTPAPPTAIPSATPYIGVFIGELQTNNDSPVIVPALSDAYRTPQPTPVTLECEILPAEEFGTTWAENNQVALGLGCPIQVLFAFQGNIQVFEHGVMYWREDTGEIWAIAPGGLKTGHYWYVAEPPELSTSEFSAPEGFRVPEGGFGSVWKGVPDVRTTLGYAQTGERRVSMAMQRYEGGSLFLDVEFGTVFAFMVNGDAYGPF